MKIMVIARGCPTLENGMQGMFEWDQALALRAAGVEICYLVLDFRITKSWRQVGLLSYFRDGIQVFEFRLPLGRLSNNALEVVARAVFRRLFRTAVAACGQPSVVHVHFFALAAKVYDYVVKRGFPLVLTEHSSRLIKNSFEREGCDRLRPIYESQTQVIAVSTFLARRIQRLFAVNARVIPNVVDVSLFAPSSKKKLVHGLEIVSCGSLNAGKRHAMTIRAFARLLTVHRDARLTIFGSGPDMKVLLELCRSLGCEDQVSFPGMTARETIAKHYQDADFFVLPSAFETFGVAYVEAMAVGLPVIATRCGGPEDFIDDTNGILIPVDDQQALEEALLFMAEQHSKFDRVKISNQVRERFSPSTIAEQLIQLYSDVIKPEGKVKQGD